MQLLDDHLFRLWKNNTIIKEDALNKANMADALAERMITTVINNAKPAFLNLIFMSLITKKNDY
jgi:Tfp pilus assembly ATPase PilU